jgi:hypothetical protein
MIFCVLPPLPQSSNPLSSLAQIGLQGEVNQLTWQFCPDSASPQGKSAPSKVPFHWAEGKSDQLPGISKRNSGGQGLPQKRGRKIVITSGVNVCVYEQPDSSLLQAQVCGSMAERLWSPHGSVLRFRGDPRMTQGGVSAT